MRSLGSGVSERQIGSEHVNLTLCRHVVNGRLLPRFDLVRVLQQQRSAEYDNRALETSFRGTIDPTGNDAEVSQENAETDVSPKMAALKSGSAQVPPSAGARLK